MTTPGAKPSALLAAAILAMASPGPAVAEIGTVAAVNRDMRGTPPAEETRDKRLGDEVVTDERIQTSARGSGQLLFVDRTALSVAPNSDIVLDRYVFDPDRGTGEMGMSMTRGTLRFIGGQITKQQPAVVRTPTATIGIRGGMALIEIDASGALRVTALQAEQVTVRTYGDADGDGFDDGPGGAAGNMPESEVILARSGAVAEVPPGGGGVAYAGIATAATLAPGFGAIEGGGGGGTPAPPTPSAVERQSAPVREVNSGRRGGENLSPVTTTGRVQPRREATDAGTTSDDPAFARENTDTIAQIVQDTLDEGMDNDFVMIPDTGDVADLTGTATYEGGVTGLSFDTAIAGGDPSPDPVSGRFGLSYDFDDRTGALDVEVPDGRFTVDVTADPGDAASYAGRDEIFGGPDTIAAEGQFLANGTPDPAARTAGTLDIDLGTRQRAIEATFEGPRK